MRRADFNLGAKWLARRDFRFHGRPFARGDEFLWRKLSCSERKLHQLWDNGFVLPEGTDEVQTERERKSAEEVEREAAELKEKRRASAQKAREAKSDPTSDPE